MKNIIKLEEAAMFGISVFGLFWLHSEWYWYLLIIFGPDISFIGYALGSHAGAGFYNIFHHKGFAVFIFFIGIYTVTPIWETTGIILFGHSSMDRMFGYGLKLNRGFKYTHLGVIGGEKKKERNHERSKK
ncbi:MAG: DUF4260 domain-containing protein [Chitinophagales bacterium]